MGLGALSFYETAATVSQSGLNIRGLHTRQGGRFHRRLANEELGRKFQTNGLA